MKPTLALPLAALMLTPLALPTPARAQSSFTWQAGSITVTHAAGIGCLPRVSTASATPGGQQIALSVASNVSGTASIRMEVTLNRPQQAGLAYNAYDALAAGTGTLRALGQALPASLQGSTLSIRVTSCAVVPPMRGSTEPGTM